MYKKKSTILPIWTKLKNPTLEQRNKENHQKTKFQTDPANNLKETSYNYYKKLKHSIQIKSSVLQVQSNYMVLDKANKNPLQAQITPKHCLFPKHTRWGITAGTRGPQPPGLGPIPAPGLPHPGRIKGFPPLENPNSTFKPSSFKHPQRNLGPKRSWANFRCLVI
jgi:hypothetical protein